MGKKRNLIDSEHEEPRKKLKCSDDHEAGGKKGKYCDASKSIKKHDKKSSHKHRSKHRKKKRRKDYSDSSSTEETSSSDSSSSSSSTSTDDEKIKRRRLKKKKRRHKKSKHSKMCAEKGDEPSESIPESCIGPLPPGDSIKNARLMAPMTKEEWEKRQSVVKRVYDEETGRHRLIKGDGEILEEIVSRDRHKEINRLATKGDGSFFESSIQNKLRSNNS